MPNFSKEKAISLSLNADSADLNMLFPANKILSNTKDLISSEADIETVNQALGRVSIARFKDSNNKTFTVAMIETEQLYSDIGMPKNRIFLRRISSILRQRQEPLVVLVKSPLPAGSSLINTFMFQARLKIKYAISSWKSVLGIENYLLMGRGVTFGLNAKSNSINFILNEESNSE